jgi:hypothetical protein
MLPSTGGLPACGAQPIKGRHLSYIFPTSALHYTGWLQAVAGKSADPCCLHSPSSLLCRACQRCGPASNVLYPALYFTCEYSYEDNRFISAIMRGRNLCKGLLQVKYVGGMLTPAAQVHLQAPVPLGLLHSPACSAAPPPCLCSGCSQSRLLCHSATWQVSCAAPALLPNLSH